MGETDLSIAVLRAENNTGYGLKELPAERDAELRALLERRSIGDLVLQVSQDMHAVLRVFAERAAALAVRKRDPSLLRLGLQALALAGLSSRDSLTILPLFIDAATRIGMDSRILFETVGNAFAGHARKVLEDFIDRDPHDRSLESMGYEISGEGSSFRYGRNW